MRDESFTKQIIGSFFEVYNRLGFGFLESIYAGALVVEMASRGLVVHREVPIEVKYRGIRVGAFRLDMVVADKIIVEIKASRLLVEADYKQLVNYLKATKFETGLLLHFGPTSNFRRVVYSNSRK